MDFSKLEKSLKERVDEKKINCCSAAVNVGGKRVFELNYGLTNIEENHLVTSKSRYRMASNTKPVTAVAAMICWDRGLFNIDDYVDKYIPFLKDFQVADENGNIIDQTKYRLTIRQCLSHSCGIGSLKLGENEMNNLLLNHFNERNDLESTVKFYKDFHLAFAPGTWSSYSAFCGLDIVARIVEIVSGQNYEDFIKENIFIPCEMTSTSYNYKNTIPEDKVITYKDLGNNILEKDNNPDSNFPGLPPEFSGGGAGLISTLDDYLNFGQMLADRGVFKGKRILSEAAFTLLTTPNPKYEYHTQWTSHWGLGLFVNTERNNVDRFLPVGTITWSGAFGTHFWADPIRNIVGVYMHNSFSYGGSGVPHVIQFEREVMEAINCEEKEYVIQNQNIKVVIAKKGAEMVSVKYNNKERLWQNDNGSWSKHAPILFPHAGKCSIVVDGVHYPDQFHGFARDLEWEFVSQEEHKLTMVLKSSEFTKKTYPYDFEFYVTYELVGNTIRISQCFKNTSDRKIYFFIGAHESYATDSEISNYYIEFEKDEKFDSLFFPEFGVEHIGEGKILSLSSKLLDNSSTIILHNINSRKVSLKDNSGKLLAETTFADFPNLLLWHSEGSKMICIEPWMNLPDYEKDYEVELKDKENVVSLDVGEEKTLIRTISYFD